MASTFISYRRDDSAGYAGRLCESLERRLGNQAVFRDVDTIEPGQDFIQAISARLKECRVLVALIGREWLDARDSAGRRRLDHPNDYVRLEIEAALQRSDVIVVPALVEGVEMPEPEQLPESIRALSRRHAVSLRDETWDEDVARLATVIGRAAGPAEPRQTNKRWLMWAALAGVVIAGILAARTFGRGEPGNVRPHEAQPFVPTSAYGIPMSSSIEAAHGRVIFTLISGNVIPNGSSNTVRLRMRFSNEGSYDENFWDASFRLLAGDNVLAPTSNLNEVVPGHSLRQGIVTFDVPADVRKATFRISATDAIADVPLDLTPTRAEAIDERADAGDALSHATIRPVIRDSRTIVQAGTIKSTLVSVYSRRFVNKLRLMVSTRLVNDGPYPVHSGVITLRLMVNEQPLAPVDMSNVAIAAHASASVDYVFEVSPDAEHLTLHALLGTTTADIPLDRQ